MKIQISQILKRKKTYTVTGTLWIELENERFFGPGRVELLGHIEKTGSITQAAREMGMSYKKAWEMVAAMNRQAACKMVLVQTGGEKGGGSEVTDAAKALILYHRQLRKRFLSFLERETKKLK